MAASASTFYSRGMKKLGRNTTAAEKNDSTMKINGEKNVVLNGKSTQEGNYSLEEKKAVEMSKIKNLIAEEIFKTDSAESEDDPNEPDYQPSTQSSSSSSSEEEVFKKSSKTGASRPQKPAVKKPKPTSRKRANSPVDEELSELQKIRKQNIAAREEYMADLGLAEAAQNLKDSMKKVKKARVAVVKEPLPPREKSQRIMMKNSLALEPDNPPQQNLEKVFSMQSVIYNPFLDDPINVAEFFEGIQEKLRASGGGGRSLLLSRQCPVEVLEQTYSELNPVDWDLRKSLPKGMVTGLSFYPSSSVVVLATGSISGGVGMVEIVKNDGDWTCPNVAMFEVHLAPVSCVQFSQFHNHKVFTTSHDGTLREGDMNRQVFSLVYGLEQQAHQTSPTPLLWVCEKDPSVLFVAQKNGCVALLDTRSPRESLFRCHVSSIPTVSVCARRPEALVTCSSGGEVALWDLRKMSSRSELRTMSSRSLNFPMTHGRVWKQDDYDEITSAFISMSGIRILVTMGSSSITVLDAIEEDRPLETWSARRAPLPSKGIASGLVQKAVWYPGREDEVCISSAIYPYGVDLFRTEPSAHLLSTHVKAHLTDHKRSGEVTFHPCMTAMAAATNNDVAFYI